MLNICLINCKNGSLREYSYVINIPIYTYYNKKEINSLAHVLYQQLADDFGLPVVTLDAVFEPKNPLDMDIVNGSENNTPEKTKDCKLYDILRKGPKKIPELQKIINKSQPVVGKRLKRMADEGLVVKQDSYWLIPPSRLRILEIIEELEQEN